MVRWFSRVPRFHESLAELVGELPHLSAGRSNLHNAGESEVRHALPGMGMKAADPSMGRASLRRTNLAEPVTTG